MKTLATIFFTIIGISIILFIRDKILTLRDKNDKIYEDQFRIQAQQDPITATNLKGYGFKIYDTKDKIYALHPNGISMTRMEGHQWEVNSGRSFGRGPDSTTVIYYIHELIEFAEVNNKPINQEDT